MGEVLLAAADLIEPEGAWTQGELAHDGDGREADPLGEEATCWCVSGAIMRAQGDRFLATEKFWPLERLIGLFPLWNDAPERTQSEVVAKLREAAALSSGVSLGDGK